MSAAVESGPRPLFRTILCGVDGTAAGLEAVRQAAVLAGGEARLTLLAVRWDGGDDAGRRDVQNMLEHAANAARAEGVEPRVASETGADPAELLLLEAAGSDLVVVGDHARPRSAGIAIGSTALALVHRSAAPVLVARRPWHDTPFPGTILLPVTGQVDAVTTAIAGHLAAAHGSRVVEVRAERPDDLADAVVTAAAAGHGAGLVITSGHPLPASAVLRTTAERIAGAAPCSVLIARTPSPRCG